MRQSARLRPDLCDEDQVLGISVFFIHRILIKGLKLCPHQLT